MVWSLSGRGFFLSQRGRQVPLMVHFFQVVREKALVTTALCFPNAKQQSGKEVWVRNWENVGRNWEIFFLGIYWLQVFNVYIFEVSFLYNQISSVISFRLLLPTFPVSDCSWIYIGGKKNLPLIFLVFVCFRWTKWDELEAKCCSQIILQISDCR